MRLLLAVLCSLSISRAQDGYFGYILTDRGDPESVIYETADTAAAGNVSTTNPPPDVYLNASVSVGEIDIDVENLTAQIDLSAKVLSLLDFNAGVHASIDRVSLKIQNITAKVLLEARLSNIALMIDSVLNSLDLNPVLATLGQDVGQILNDTAGAVSGTSRNVKTRSEDYDLLHNILYSVSDYSGNTHTNRILEQNGDIVDQRLDNDGNVKGQNVVGNYKADMTYSGRTLSTTRDGKPVSELEYNYHPFPGLMVVAAIVFDEANKLVGTQVLAESGAGGSSTIGN